MSSEQPKRAGAISRAWRWVKGQIVGEVPQDIAMCEFDCRKGQCMQDEWETCERRLSGASGELKPGPKN